MMKKKKSYKQDKKLLAFSILCVVFLVCLFVCLEYDDIINTND